MKYLTFDDLLGLNELTVRQNGKTTEAVKACLNSLFNFWNPLIIYVGYNLETCKYAKNLALDLLVTNPRLEVKITHSDTRGIKFEAVNGTNTLRFIPLNTIPLGFKGLSPNEMIFDIDVETLLKGTTSGETKLVDIISSIGPTMAALKSIHQLDPNKLIKFF